MMMVVVNDIHSDDDDDELPVTVREFAWYRFRTWFKKIYSRRDGVSKN